ncbi:hypothetical protein GCM10022215_32740 [Nocardioides fonticola]|uniref:Camelysin-like metallo-endopeptidase n=1 Tax=Nocardioides fonticola TaxID=450363 RepID=A0ABP7XSG0_9ACTN
MFGVSGTWAHWTDSVVVSGTTLTSGTIDLKIDNLDAVTTTTLSMSAMVPGNTSAQVVTLKNAGTAPLDYTVAGGLGGTDAAAFSSAGAAKLRLVVGGTRSGSGNAATCTGGTVLLASTSLTSTTSTTLVGTRQGPIASAGTVSMCVELTFDANAPQSLAGTTATVTLTFTGTTDIS